MCRDCGCSLGPAAARAPLAAHHPAPAGQVESIELITAILGENDRVAAHNRAHFDEHGVLAINLMSSPGSGKTSLLEATIRALAGELRVAVIAGDLDAQMVHDALHGLKLAGLDILFVENVGNLVCPASFDLGVHRNVTLLSVPEGDDKPAKYPVMFRGADLALITKTDLLAYIDEFKPERARASLRQVGYAGQVIELTRRGGEGFMAWLAWLRSETAALRQPAATGG